jgi:hypothetical protein
VLRGPVESEQRVSLAFGRTVGEGGAVVAAAWSCMRTGSRMIPGAGEPLDSIANVVCMWWRPLRARIANRGVRMFFADGSSATGTRSASADICQGRLIGVQSMVRSLSIIVRLTLRVNASVPFSLGFISAQRSLTTPLLRSSDLFADPGVLRIASFPSRLFFRKVFVLPCLGVTHSLNDMAEPTPAPRGMPVAAL